MNKKAKLEAKIATLQQELAQDMTVFNQQHQQIQEMQQAQALNQRIIDGKRGRIEGLQERLEEEDDVGGDNGDILPGGESADSGAVAGLPGRDLPESDNTDRPAAPVSKK
jgi:hypothetical protein